LVVVALDVVEIGRLAEAGALVEVAGVGPELRVVDEAAEVALEVADVDGVEAGQGREEADVGVGEAVADEEALTGEALPTRRGRRRGCRRRARRRPGKPRSRPRRRRC
jgi:hypothetical protein